MQNKPYQRIGLKKNVGPKIRTSTDTVILECTDTPEHLNITIDQIDQQHKNEGVLNIKYHFVIMLDGKIEIGRQKNTIGFKIKNTALHIGIVGSTSFNSNQKKSLKQLIKKLNNEYGELEIINNTPIKNYD